MVTGMQGAMNGPIYSVATTVIMTRWDRQVAVKACIVLRDVEVNRVSEQGIIDWCREKMAA